MKISARCEYACRAMLELAQRYRSEETVNSAAIAERRDIPEKYLVHILLQLKRVGLVQSIRGARGGYRLGFPPEQISLHDIVTAIDGPLEEQLPLGPDSAVELRPAWGKLAEALRTSMDGITLRDILESSSQSQMYYI